MFAEYVRDNPIVTEYRRHVRRFFAPTQNQTVNIIAVVLLGMIYCGMLLMALQVGKDMQPEPVFVIQLLITCFVVPAMAHGTIAGEREKRTWDLLLVAPISKGQIVAGKFLAACAVVGLIALTMVPFLFLCLFNVQYFAEYGATPFFLGEFIVLGYGVTLAAVSIWFSASVHRSLIAHGLVWLFQVAWLMITPFVMSGVVGGPSRNYIAFHPFVSVTEWRNYEVTTYPAASAPTITGLAERFPLLLLYLVLTIAAYQFALSKVRNMEEI